MKDDYGIDQSPNIGQPEVSPLWDSRSANDIIRELRDRIAALETQLAAVTAERDRSNAACKSMANEILRLNNKLDKDSQHFELECCKADRDSFRAQLGEVTAERDAAREALKKGTDRLLPFEKECYVLREQLGVVRDAAVQAEQDYQQCREALRISDDALEEFRADHRKMLTERDSLTAQLVALTAERDAVKKWRSLEGKE